MSNSFIMWSLALVPWLTLFFMKKEDIKRYTPVGLLAIVTTTIIYDVGTTLGFWTPRQSFFPLGYLEPYNFGTMPVLTMWVFKYTEKKFWTYMITNTILDLGFNFFLLGYFFPLRGILDFNIYPLFSLPITLGHAVVLYVYQIWQDDVLLNTNTNTNTNNLTSHTIQPAAAKLFTYPPKDDRDDRDDKDDKDDKDD